MGPWERYADIHVIKKHDDYIRLVYFPVLCWLFISNIYIYIYTCIILQYFQGKSIHGDSTTPQGHKGLFFWG